jgi:hypothetical protein
MQASFYRFRRLKRDAKHSKMEAQIGLHFTTSSLPDCGDGYA